MSEISKELLEKLTNAKTREEAAALLKAEGIEDAPEEKIWEQVQQLRVPEAQELSLDELDDVAGGATERDWWTSGCAATVEPGSDCWGTDGGCSTCNIKYYNKDMIYDICIVGAGITGSLLARELARYKLKILVLEKENDVGNQTTNANSAIIHSGYDPEPGTLKAKLNVLGNAKYDQLTKELDVKFSRIGSLTVATEEEQLPMLKDLAERSKINGVEVKLLSPEEVIAIEPNISKEVKGALFAPTAGIIDPFNLCVHAMENAIDNGVELRLNNRVIDIKENGDLFEITTDKDKYQSRIVINCAGNYADRIAALMDDIDWKITPRKGEYFVLDHFDNTFVKHTIFPLPSKKGKGILVSPTYSGDYIVGPSSEEVQNKEDYATDAPTLNEVKNKSSILVPNIPFGETIRVFSGLRPTPSTHDFIISYSKKSNHFINVAGIESPGLASSPAISDYVIENLVKPIIDLKPNPNFNAFVRPYRIIRELPDEEKQALINKNHEYGQIICNCEKISLGEIKDVLSRSCPPRSVKGVKRRTRAGFGKCQGGFCQSSVLLLLAEHYGVSPLDILLDNEGSNILVEKVKDN